MREKDEDEDDCCVTVKVLLGTTQLNILSSSGSESLPVKSEDGQSPVGGASWPMGGALWPVGGALWPMGGASWPVGGACASTLKLI